MNTVMSGLDREGLANFWDNWDWDKSRSELFDLQRSLAALVQCREAKMVAEKQSELVNSLAAKMLAVAKVCEAAVQPGVDGVRWRNSWEKMSAALRLDNEEYAAEPYRLLIVKTKRGKERNIKLPTMKDRAMQVLHSFALDPVAEVLADKKSFGFRKCRSALDAHCHVLKMLEGRDPPKYIVKVDVQQHYESISHKWLIKNVPMDKHVLGEFLKSGHVFEGELFPPEDMGLSIGGSISPLLANFALDGLQEAIFRGLYRYGAIEYKFGSMVRFADDVVITAKDKTQGREILSIVSRFLRVRGMRLSPTKTKICSTKEGFEFLSKYYQQINGAMFVSPSESAVARFEADLFGVVSSHKGSQQSLVETLNRKLTGWAGHHKYSDASDAFRKIDTLVSALLLDLCESRHRAKNTTSERRRKSVIQKYFTKDADGHYVYCLPDKKHVRVVRLGKIPLVHHTPAAISRNPYLDSDYFFELTRIREVQNVVGSYKSIWLRQNGRCYFCVSPIMVDQEKEIAIKDHAYPEKKSNMAYIHSKCSNVPIDTYKTNQHYGDSSDVLRLLESMEEGKVYTDNINRFSPLKDYLWEQTKADISLKYQELEEILGFKIPSSAKDNNYWWKRRWAGSFTMACHDTGYEVKRVNFKRRTIHFKRIGEKAAVARFPDVFFKGKLPVDAVTELTAFLQYLRDKYGF